MHPDECRSEMKTVGRSAPISGVIESIEKQQAVLLETLNVLGDRIGSVLGGEIDAPTAPRNSEDSSNSYLYHRLNSIGEANEALIYRLNRLIDRVEL